MSMGEESNDPGNEVSEARLEAEVDRFLRKGMVEKRPDRGEDAGEVAGEGYDDVDVDDEDEDEDEEAV